MPGRKQILLIPVAFKHAWLSYQPPCFIISGTLCTGEAPCRPWAWQPAATAAAPPPADAQTAGNGKLKIGAVEIWKVEGHQETLRGVDHQAPVF